MGQGTEEEMKRYLLYIGTELPDATEEQQVMKAVLCFWVVDSHADGLCLFRDLPESEEQVDRLSLVQQQGLRGRLSF